MMDGFAYFRYEIPKVSSIFHTKWTRSIQHQIQQRLSFDIRSVTTFKYMQWSLYDIILQIDDLIHRCITFMSKTITRRIAFLLFIKIPMTWFYYFNLFFPLLIIKLFISFVVSVLSVLCRRSIHVRRVVLTAKALHDIVWKSIRKISCMKVSELTILIANFSYDILKQLLFSRATIDPNDNTLGFGEISDIVYYEESEPQITWEPVRARMKKLMHQFVPPNTFKATVRIRPETTGTSSEIASTYHTGYNTEGDILLEADSPMSFPTTPLSRARVMNRSTERVSSVMFAARDRLRLDELSFSRDELSRQAAIEARDRGKYAALDPQQASEGLALTCGNHCAFKVGDALCCSCRAMIPIRRNTYTYFEFSITASHETIPMVSVGIASLGCPLNVMVGSWATSLGLYTDGQLLVESKWYKSSKYQSASDTGVTVGVLVFLPQHDQTMINRSQSHSTLRDLNSSNSFFGGLSAFIQFNVNGVPMDYDLPISVLKKLDENNAEIFPTISILSQGTRVWCRFCEADIVYRNRRAIRAPPFVKVYCLDGSRLLGEKD